MKKIKIKIKKNEVNPESIELLAKSIVQVAEGFKKIQGMPLTQDAIIVLLQNRVGAHNISKSQIRLVLDNLPRLKSWYIKSPFK